MRELLLEGFWLGISKKGPKKKPYKFNAIESPPRRAQLRLRHSLLFRRKRTSEKLKLMVELDVCQGSELHLGYVVLVNVTGW